MKIIYEKRENLLKTALLGTQKDDSSTPSTISHTTTVPPTSADAHRNRTSAEKPISSSDEQQI